MSSSSIEFRMPDIHCQGAEGAEFARAMLKKNRCNSDDDLIDDVLIEFAQATIAVAHVRFAKEQAAAEDHLRTVVGCVNWLNPQQLQLFVNRLGNLRKSTEFRDEEIKKLISAIFLKKITGINEKVLNEIMHWQETVSRKTVNSIDRLSIENEMSTLAHSIRFKMDAAVRSYRQGAEEDILNEQKSNIKLLEKYFAELAKTPESLPEIFSFVQKIGFCSISNPLYKILQNSETVPQAIKFCLGAAVAIGDEGGSDDRGWEDFEKNDPDQYLRFLSAKQIELLMQHKTKSSPHFLQLYMKSTNVDVCKVIASNLDFQDWEFIFHLRNDMKDYCQQHEVNPTTCHYPEDIQKRIDLIKILFHRVVQPKWVIRFLSLTPPAPSSWPPTDPLYLLLLDTYKNEKETAIRAIIKWLANDTLDSHTVLVCLWYAYQCWQEVQQKGEFDGLFRYGMVFYQIDSYFRINFIEAVRFISDNTIGNQNEFLEFFSENLTIREVEEFICSLCKSIAKENGKQFSKEIKRDLTILINDILPLIIRKKILSEKITDGMREIQKNESLFQQIFHDKSVQESVRARIEQMQKSVTAVTLATAQRAALANQTQLAIFKGEIHSHSFLEIEQLRSHFKNSSLDNLKKIFLPVLNDIKKLQVECKLRFYPETVSFSGQDSLNRELLISTGWNDALRKPEVILGLFALEAASDYETSLTQYNFLFSDRTITGMLAFGLGNHPPALLEVLPLNKHRVADTGIAHVKEHLQRKDIQQTFVPILHAIDVAYKEVFGMPPSLAAVKTVLEKPYDVTQWKEHQKYLHEILTYIKDKNEEELFTLEASSYTPEDLKRQTSDGFKRLLSKIGIQSQNETLENIVQSIATSYELLDATVSHLFYDRLHLLVGLKSNLLIPLKEGKQCCIRDVVVELISSFAKNGVSADNAIAAEQFYFRLLFLAEKLKIADRVEDRHSLIEHYEAELDTDPKNRKIRYELACQYLAADNFITALPLLKTVLEQLQEVSRDLQAVNDVKQKIDLCERKSEIQTSLILQKAKKCNFETIISSEMLERFEEDEHLFPIEATLIRFYTSKFYKVINLFLRKEMGPLQQFPLEKLQRVDYPAG